MNARLNKDTQKVDTIAQIYREIRVTYPLML